MADNRETSQTYKPKSLLEISARIVVRNLYSAENLFALKGEIPLTLVKYLGKNYCDFFDDYLAQLKSFITRNIPEPISNMHPSKLYTLVYTCVLFREEVTIRDCSRYCVHRFCTYCYKEYVKFKLSKTACNFVCNINKQSITYFGDMFHEQSSQLICQKCRLILLEADDFEKPALAQSQLSIIYNMDF